MNLDMILLLLIFITTLQIGWMLGSQRSWNKCKPIMDEKDEFIRKLVSHLTDSVADQSVLRRVKLQLNSKDVAKDIDRVFERKR